MHFKKLELYGFKSFADKTTLHFEPGVTAIVGPNGCGKTNLLDGIRWVMGEQNPRDLRGSAMMDVIFNGTDKKEPLNFAEVSLTLSNESRIFPIEYDEVTVTRRLFRSGESEYLLNKIPVRLKDITELFMDTGLGSGGYWTIEQGKIDMILSSRPEDRRSIFEEASGINKYKTKKKEALRKLEQTEQNLLRLSDIISEVKRQINSIERQAQKAKKYQELFEKLKDMDVRLAYRSYNELKNNQQTVFADRSSLKERENLLANSESELSQNLTSQRSQLEDLNQKLSEFNNELLTIASTIQRNIDKINLNAERIEELESRRSLLSEEITTLDEKLKSLAPKLDNLRAELNAVDEEKRAKEEVLASKEKELNDIAELMSRTQSEISNAKLQVIDVATKEARAKNELAKLGADLNNLNARLRRLGVEKEKLENERAQVKEKLDAAHGEEESQKGKVEEIRRKAAELETGLNSRLEELKTLDGNLLDVENELTTKSAKLESLEELHRRREGFSAGVRFIMEEKEKGALTIPGINGVVADLITVERGYEEALEAAIGDSAQAIVIDSQEQALQAMSYLSSAGCGRAKFICLDKLAANLQAQDIAHPGLLEKALSYVRSDPKYTSLLAYLLDGIYVAKDMNSAVEVARTNGSLREIVTMQGEIVDKATVVGGAQGGIGLLGRETRIKELKCELEALSEKKRNLQETKVGLSAQVKALEEEAKSQRQALHEGEIALANKISICASFASDEKKIEDEYALVTLELDETQNEHNGLKSKEENLTVELANLESQGKNIHDFIEKAQELIADKAKEKEELLVQAAQARTELNLIQERSSARASAFGMLEGSFKLDEQSKAAKEREIEGSKGKIDTLTNEISQLESQNTELASKKETLERDRQGLKESQKGMLETVSKYDSDLSSIRKEVEDLRNQLRDKDLAEAQLGYEMSSLKEKIAQSYQIDLDQVTYEAALDEDWEALNQEATRLKEKLKDMGPVNLVAIEEEKELTDRYNFLSAQESDLLQAKDSLVKAIQKINSTSKELFLDGFQKVQVTFREYFRMLFGGGDAELVILDESDVLESGIEIVVRPPGKKLQNISLLSGGERALCAIALLFAIFKVRPSPFCILDEIDAPLDESNIDRFTRLLCEFVKTSQFIMITHNKKTISVADVMYGVTMEESGVSKLVSVKFQEAPARTA